VVCYEGSKNTGNAYTNELILYLYGKAGKPRTSSFKIATFCCKFQISRIKKPQFLLLYHNVKTTSR